MMEVCTPFTDLELFNMDDPTQQDSDNDDGLLPPISPDDLLPSISSDDWINQLQMFDLPLFFTNNGIYTPPNNNNNNNTATITSPLQEHNGVAQYPNNSATGGSQVPPTTAQGQVVDINKIKKHISSSNVGTLGEPTPAEINAVIQQHVIKESQQHPVPGPIKRANTIASKSKSISPIAEPKTNKTAVSLTRDQLLSFTSEDMDNFEKEITKNRPLTPSERKEMKRQRRLIKNRESAHLSRRRKKDRVDELEQVVGGLTTINNEISTKLQNLEAEQTTLKAEVSQLIGVIRDSPILSGLLRNVASVLIYYAVQASEAKKLATASLPLSPTPQNSIEAC